MAGEMKFNRRGGWLSAVLAVATAVVSFVVVAGAVVAAPSDSFDGFIGPLDSEWTIRDGYAVQFPADTVNNATIAPTGTHLSLSFPASASHNQWDLRHAEVQRSYPGSGAYQIKVDSSFLGDEQVGLSFETSPGTFMHFMLYAKSPGDQVFAYAERFVNSGTFQNKATVAGVATGLVVPQDGPWYLRVVVSDYGSPVDRTWRFEWSTDESNWNAVTNGVLETVSENVGVIDKVGIFAGNQSPGFPGFDAQIDYFSFTTPPAIPSGLAVNSVSDTVLGVVWDDVVGEGSYEVEVSTDGGAFVAVPESPLPAGTTTHDATGLTAGVEYCYRVQAVNYVGPSGFSVSQCASPRSGGGWDVGGNLQVATRLGPTG